MQIVFRVDIAKHIGRGHLQRCLTLAEELKKRGHTCLFLGRDYLDDFLVISSLAQPYEVIAKAPQECFINNSNSTEKDWLLVSEEEDANDFVKYVKKKKIRIDLIIVDHYSLSSIWEETIYNKINCMIAVIDDLANRKHLCHLLIDQNYYEDFERRYISLVPKTTHQLLGPSYAILHPIFNKLNSASTRKKKPHVLVNFGGVGNLNIWNKIIPALKATIDLFHYNVVTGKFVNEENYYQVRDSLQAKGISCVESTQEMPNLMSRSDFAIGACGTTVWERFSLGLNSALVDIAPNQTELINFLFKQDLIDYLGSSKELQTENLVDYLRSLNIYGQKYINRKEKIMRLVDGSGLVKIANHIEALHSSKEEIL